MARTKQVTPPRISDATYSWLVGMSGRTGMSMGTLAGLILDRACAEGWQVQPLAVLTAADSAQP